jgi:hypothetical protein
MRMVEVVDEACYLPETRYCLKAYHSSTFLIQVIIKLQGKGQSLRGSKAYGYVYKSDLNPSDTNPSLILYPRVPLPFLRAYTTPATILGFRYR